MTRILGLWFAWAYLTGSALFCLDKAVTALAREGHGALFALALFLPLALAVTGAGQAAFVFIVAETAGHVRRTRGKRNGGNDNKSQRTR